LCNPGPRRIGPMLSAAWAMETHAALSSPPRQRTRVRRLEDEQLAQDQHGDDEQGDHGADDDQRP
jgi:hypothetical protein